MKKQIWFISEEKRREFDSKYQNLILSIPKALWEKEDYMPYWYSELSFPIIRKEFLDKLSIEKRELIRELYQEILKH